MLLLANTGRRSCGTGHGAIAPDLPRIFLRRLETLGAIITTLLITSLGLLTYVLRVLG